MCWIRKYKKAQPSPWNKFWLLSPTVRTVQTVFEIKFYNPWERGTALEMISTASVTGRYVVSLITSTSHAIEVLKGECREFLPMFPKCKQTPVSKFFRIIDHMALWRVFSRFKRKVLILFSISRVHRIQVITHHWSECSVRGAPVWNEEGKLVVSFPGDVN